MEEYESSDGVAAREFKRLRNIIRADKIEIAKLNKGINWTSTKDEMPDTELYENASFAVVITEPDCIGDNEFIDYADCLIGLSDPGWNRNVTKWLVLPSY